MDTFVDERDYKILESDKYTFFVLKRIIGNECHVLLTDHERLIICHTANPFPVWVWTPDDASEDEIQRAYEITMEVLPASEGYKYNLKYELAEYFMKKAAEDGNELTIKTNMFAYDCPEPIEPEYETDGELHKCTTEDVDELVEIMDLFHNELDIDKESLEAYRESAEYGVKSGFLYFWKNSEGRHVASCTWRTSDDMASIGLVYTRKDARRNHYAENLVYRVTNIAKEAGFLPMLYTDADYVASNSCYEKIGYILRGKLCTIG
ncbi:MAG: GNAT family N-acetyltransferase [Eubacterium sp.]|nr:GNAT family N-acetyltransferase [Eubacterium sp.]